MGPGVLVSGTLRAWVGVAELVCVPVLLAAFLTPSCALQARALPGSASRSQAVRSVYVWSLLFPRNHVANCRGGGDPGGLSGHPQGPRFAKRWMQSRHLFLALGAMDSKDRKALSGGSGRWKVRVGLSFPSIVHKFNSFSLFVGFFPREPLG